MSASLQDRLRGYAQATSVLSHVRVMEEAADRIDELEAELASTLPDTMIERACAGKWGEHHWPRVPNAEGERQAMRAALEAVGLLEAKTQDHEPSLDGLPLGPHAYRLRLAREREDAARHDQDARVTGLLIDLARMEVSEAREGHRYELDHDRGWIRATLAEGTYIGPDPSGSGSRDSVRRATDTNEGPTG